MGLRASIMRMPVSGTSQPFIVSTLETGCMAGLNCNTPMSVCKLVSLAARVKIESDGLKGRSAVWRFDGFKITSIYLIETGGCGVFWGLSMVVSGVFEVLQAVVMTRTCTTKQVTVKKNKLLLLIE